MATTTPNFGWPVPTSTDLVKNGATAIEALGDAIDASLLDLKGGTTGQVLKKNTNTDMDFVWSADSAGMTNPMTTTGDTIYSSSGSTPARLAIGTTGQVLTVAGGVPTWAAASGGGGLSWSLLNSPDGTALTGATTVTVSGISNKEYIMVLVKQASSATAGVGISVRINADSNARYDGYGVQLTAPSTYAVGNLSGLNMDANTSIPLGDLSSSASSVVNGSVFITGGLSTGTKSYTALGTANAGGGNGQYGYMHQGVYRGVAAISSISVVSGSGNLDSGTVFIYAA